MQWSKHQIKMQPTKKTRDIRVLLYGVNLDNMSFVTTKVSMYKEYKKQTTIIGIFQSK